MYEAIGISMINRWAHVDDKLVREERLSAVYEEVNAQFDEVYPEQGALIENACKAAKVCGSPLDSDEGKRVDGRG